MDAQNTTFATRLGAYTAIAGSACAILGAALGIVSGADMDASLASNDMATYLTTAGETSRLLVANLTLWIVMVLLMGIAATAMTALCEKRPMMAQVARFCYWAGAPLVLGAYVAWLAVVVQVAPDTSPAAIALAKAMGWFASRADWVATILIIGIGPTFISLAGRDAWVPRWLLRWSFATAVAGLLNAVAMFTGGSGLGSYGFLIIPVGVGWMVAAGIVLLRGVGTTLGSQERQGGRSAA